ncbi:MAG: DUF2191 domain-containing protein [Deltaproteobacteria bacterium]|nr:DUF2191 domain-containing protein [Deltaproteobacteria bacterium]
MALWWLYGAADMVAHMKTTIELPKGLLREAKALAARESTTLRALIEEGLRLLLKQRKEKTPEFKLRDCRFGGEGLQPGWDLNDFSKMRAASYGERGGDVEK